MIYDAAQEERIGCMSRYRRYFVGLAIVVVLLGAYAAVGFLAVPYFARKTAVEFVRSHYGRALSIAEIHFNPFTLDLEVAKLALPDADGQPMLAFERLDVDLQWASLWRLGPSFGSIFLEQPYVRAVLRRDGALNLADLGKGLAPAPASAQKKSAPMRLYVGRLAVISGTSVFEDRTRPTPFHAEFKPIAFELRDFSTTAATGDLYALNAASPEGERLIWSGTLRLEPLSSHGVFEIADLKARTVWNYLRDSVPFEIASGVIGIKGDYHLASSGNGPLGLNLSVHSTTVTSLGVRPKGAAQDYVDVARIEVDETRLDLTRHSVNVAKVRLSGGDIKAWLEAGRLNLLELVPSSGAQGAAAAPPAADSASAGPTAPSAAAPAVGAGGASAWSVAAPDIAIEGFKVSAEDRQVKPAAALLLNPVNIHVVGFDLTPDDTLDITLDSGVNSSGKIDVRARVTPKAGAMSAHVESANLELTMLQPYIAQYTSMTLLKGALGTKLDIERDADGALSVKGSTQVSDLRTVDNALRQDFIKWRELRVADIRYRAAPASLKVGNVTALEPYVRMIIAPDRSVNVSKVLTAPGAVPKAAAAPAAAPATGKAPAAAAKSPPALPAPLTPFPMSIGTVRFVSGSANYSDLWIKPSFAVGIQTLSGTVTGLSSDPKSRAKMELDGKLDRYSPVHIGGELNLLSAALYTDVTMSFKDVDLTIVNPYSGHFAGYKIDKGKLSVDVTYKIDQRKLDAKQHFVIDQLQLGDQVDSPDAVHLPFKLAVALLKDRNGLIDLNLPMNGSLDDPTFRIGPIIWKIFVNLITKAATAPFALLGHLFGGGEHMNIVEFAPGSAELEKPARDQLASLVTALKERPQLNLDVPIVYSIAIDRPQMAAARLRAELLARVRDTRAGRQHPDTAGELALADPEKHFKLLLEQYQADLGRDAQLPPTAVAVQQAKRKQTPPYDLAISDLNAALIDHIHVPDTELEALGKQRAQAIQDALLTGGEVEPSRVFIVNTPPKPATGDKVKVELAVK
jgi:Domain of Unknown Function (DUF748)